MIYDFIIIGSGPNSILSLLYLSNYYPNLKIAVITPRLEIYDNTFGIFMSQIENTWILETYKKEQIFKRIYDLESKFIEETIQLPDKYGIVDNIFLFSELQKLIFKNKIKIIYGLATTINQNGCITNVEYIKRNKIIKNKMCKMVLESVGNKKPIGIKYYDITKYYQSFVGYEIILDEPHSFDINKCILMDWTNNRIGFHIVNHITKSFTYIIPIDELTILVEETTLIHNKIDNNLIFNLTKVLKQKINKIFKCNYSILRKEIRTIPINIGFPSNKSNSFGIGQSGNMINTLGGYTLGYNIYHIPEYINSIIKNDFKVEKAIDEYWNYKRYMIYKTSLIGLKMLNSLDSMEIAEFQKYYAKYIWNDSYKDITCKNITCKDITCKNITCKNINCNRNEKSNNHRYFFLNCDSDMSYYEFIMSFYPYRNFPAYYLRNILYSIL